MAQEGELRRPVVAGQFYSGTRDGLIREIEQCYVGRLGPGEVPSVREDGPRRVIGLVSPHAGYMFSGGTAAHGFAHLASDGVPERVVIIGPCHRLATTAAVAIQTRGAWVTPLGHALIDQEIAAAIADAWSEFSTGAHHFAAEHSLEVQIPFLQHLYGDRLRIVPIMIAQQTASVARELGSVLSRVLEGRDAVIVASTDLSHYVAPGEAERLDKSIVERILALDPEGLMSLATQPRMTMCGYGAVAAMLHAVMDHTPRATMLAYSHSGMVHPMSEVVGYVSIVVER
jgi:AmmeMemoRadiSam system protein B